MMIPVLLGVTLIVFVIMHTIPGDPVLIMFGDQTSVGQASSAEEIERLRDIYGLNDPLPIQYMNWLGRMMMGDFGQSLITRTPVSDQILVRIPATLQLAFGALVLGLIISIPLGVAAAVYRDRLIDRISLVVASFSISVPNFWIALMMIVLFSVVLGWLPTSGRPDIPLSESFLRLFTGNVQPLWEWFRHGIMPVTALSLTIIAPLVRITRYSMLEILSADYIRTARAKGLGGRAILQRHALRNAMIPIVTMIGLQMAFLLSGSVLIETIFRWPGLGRLAYEAIRRQDYPTVQATILVVAVMFSFLNLFVDLLYAYIDPRIRYS